MLQMNDVPFQIVRGKIMQLNYLTYQT